MQINVAVTDANNIVCEVVPPQTEVITIDRGVAGNGIVSIVPVTISTFQYLRITYTNGTVQDVGPLTSTAYTATAPITIVGNTISLATVPIASGGTDATTAAGAIQNLLPSYTGNANKRLGLNSLGTALEWVLDGGGTVTSVAASGGTTGLTFTGSPITTSGTLTLGGTLAIANGGTGATTAGGALTNLGAIGAITSTDGSVTITSTGTSRDLSVAVAAATNNVIAQVRNTTGATLTKGTVVYISGATGQIPTVSKALATSDATSAQTLGMITADLANNSNGNVTIIGLITNIDTSAYTDGQQLYLSGTTAGAVTATKPYAPIHLVYVAVVEYAHPTQGKLFVKVQNGYELDEIHNVSAQTPSNGQTIVYNSSNSLWENNTVSLTIGVNGTLPIANGGTGQTTANAALNALLPLQTGNASKYLQTDGTNATWDAISLSTADITGILPTANGGTGLSSFTANGVVYASSTSALTSGSALTFDGTNFYIAGSQRLRAASTGSTSNGYQLDAGAQAHYWYLADNTTSAFNIGSGAGQWTWSNSGGELMRLTSTGLGIGTSSPAAKLDVQGAGASGVSGGVRINSYAASPSSTGLYLVANIATTKPNWLIGAQYNVDQAFEITPSTAVNGTTFSNPVYAVTNTGLHKWYNSTTQAMTLAASGGLSVGTTTDAGTGNIALPAGGQLRYSSTAYITPEDNVSGARIVTGGIIRFDAGGSERCRIDASGNLLVGTTSVYGKISSVQSGAGGYCFGTNAAANGGIYYHMQFTEAGTLRGQITSNGVLTTYATSSDYRLKENVQPMTGALEKIAALKPCTYTWKENGISGQGFIAHELQAVVPDAVTGAKDAVDADGNPMYQGIDTSFLVATLTAAIQELKAEFDAYKASHP